jgi:hypothetical protein
MQTIIRALGTSFAVLFEGKTVVTISFRFGSVRLVLSTSSTRLGRSLVPTTNRAQSESQMHAYDRSDGTGRRETKLYAPKRKIQSISSTAIPGAHRFHRSSSDGTESTNYWREPRRMGFGVTCILEDRRENYCLFNM